MARSPARSAPAAASAMARKWVYLFSDLAQPAAHAGNPCHSRANATSSAVPMPAARIAVNVAEQGSPPRHVRAPPGAGQMDAFLAPATCTGHARPRAHAMQVRAILAAAYQCKKDGFDARGNAPAHPAMRPACARGASRSARLPPWTGAGRASACAGRGLDAPPVHAGDRHPRRAERRAERHAAVRARPVLAHPLPPSGRDTVGLPGQDWSAPSRHTAQRSRISFAARDRTSAPIRS